MTSILVTLYFMTTVAFVPLFIGIMCKLSKSYKRIYKVIRLRLITLFLLFEVFLVVRLYIYLDINFTHWAFDGQMSIKAEAPFYVSEIILTILLSYILFSVSKMQRDSQTFRVKAERKLSPMSPLSKTS